MARSFKLTIAYDGTDFAGWQVQPGQPTVQDTIQRALTTVAKTPVQAIGSGRTDSGVHAIGQVASCRLPAWNATADRLARAVNRYLPPAVLVRHCGNAPDDFHAIRDSIGKRYRFQLQLGGSRDVFDYRYWWLARGANDVVAMQEAAKRFVGCHDFASLQASGSDPKLTTTRTIVACEVLPQPPAADGTPRVAIEVEADGFLYNMVRNIVGTLVEVGRGKWGPEQIDEILAAKDRGAAGPTAPPQGLFLLRVDYPDDCEIDEPTTVDG